MKIARAKTAWLAETGARLDAAYHLSEGRQAKILIDNGPNGSAPLVSLTKQIFNGARFKRYYVDSPEHGIPFMGNSDMLKSDFTSLKYISKKLSQNLNDLWIEKSWTLISCSGTIGNTVYATDNFVDKTASQHIMRVVPDTDKIPAGYLYAFLSSRFGYALLTQGTYGGVIQHIEPHHILDLPVPLLPLVEQQQIHSQIEEASRLRVEANRLLAEADAMFVQLLDVDPVLYNKLTSPNEADTTVTFTVRSDRVTATSLRARNFGKRLTDIIAVLCRSKHDALVNVLKQEPFRSGRFRQLASNGPNALELLSQSDIFGIQPKGTHISPRTVPHLEQELVSKGMILVPGQGTLGENEIFGRTRFTWGYLEGKMVAGHVVRFIPNEDLIDAGYLFTVLSSKLWFRVFRSSVYGTNLLGFLVSMLNQMPIPRFEQSIENEIGTKVKLAYENRTKAIQLENAAIAHIEEVISSWQS